jgi:hypothetical protein
MCPEESYLSSSLAGDIVWLDVLGSPLLVLSSAAAVTDLLERRGNIYSSRPFNHMTTM